jgi:hypothetical protein
MAIAASLSAFSFWQATQFADEDAEQRERTRVALSEATRDERELQALVDFDLDLSTGYCAASAEQDAALGSLLTLPSDQVASARQALVAQRLRADSLWNLLQVDWPGTACTDGDPAADPYSAASAHEWSVAADPTFGTAGLPRASAGPSDAARAERLLMYAAVAFAAALLLMTAAGLATPEGSVAPAPGVRRRGHGHWATTWRRLAWAGLAIGAALVVAEVPVVRIAGWLLATSAAMGTAWLLVIGARRRRAGSAPVRRVRWWAELVGGITLVVLALAALELSAVSGRQRAARAEADRQAVAAEHLLEAGEQMALHDLSTAADLAELDAREAAANQAGDDTGEGGRIAVARDAAATHARLLAPSSSRPADRDATPGAVGDGACPETARAQAPDYDALLARARIDDTTFGAHIASHQEDGSACTVLAALTRGEADAWASRAALLTVALVALGLGGFLLALAADPERTADPARWLLGLGIAGVGLGGLLALSVLASAFLGRGGLDRGDRVSFAQRTAAAETALARSDCGEAVRTVDGALAIDDDYAPAFALRATARMCNADDAWLISPPLAPERVRPALDDALRAADLADPGSVDVNEIAWLRLLLALQRPEDDHAALREAVVLTDEAVESATSSESAGVHVARFNRALTLLAAGDTDAEGAYRYALRCLDPAASCPGGGIDSPDLVTEYRLMALDDIELLAGRTDEAVLDRYRMLLLSDDAVVVAPAPTATSWSLTVFPQELQIEPADASFPDVRIVWYYRPHPDEPWDVIRLASHATSLADDYGNTPVASYHPLPAGEYRADVFQDGAMSHVAAVRYKAGAASERVVAPDLGVSAVVPVGWELRKNAHGVETSIGPAERPDSLVIRRVEGAWPDLDRSVDEWLDAMLDDWIAAELGPQAADDAEDVTDGLSWFLELSPLRERLYPGAKVWAAVGMRPYVADPDCGGTVIMAMVTDQGTDVASEVWSSMVLDQASTAAVPPVEGTVSPDGRSSIELPDGWVGADLTLAGSDDRFMAQDCRSGASLAVGTEDVAGTDGTDGGGPDALSTLVSARVDELAEEMQALGATDDVTVDPIAETTLASGDPAMEVTLTTTTDGVAIERRQLYALDGTTLYTVTITVPGDGDYDKVVDRALSSFALVEP